MSVAVVILAAGRGSRMKSDVPKVLHHVAHAPLLVHAMQSAQSVDAARVVIVTGHGGEAVGCGVLVLLLVCTLGGLRPRLQLG